MKILVSTPNFFPHSFGGGEVYVYRLTKELMRRGHEVTVLTRTLWERGEVPCTTGSYSFEEIPVVTYVLNPGKATAAEKHTSFGPLTRYALREIILKIKPDIVHINGIKPALTSVCNKLGIHHVVTAHHVGIACPAGSLLLPDDTICDIIANPDDCIPCCNYSRRPKWYTGGVLGRIPKWIYRPIGKRLNRIKSLSYFERGLIYPWLVEQSLSAQKIVLEQARLIVSPSLSIRDQLIRNGCDPEKIKVIPHGIKPMEKLPFEPFDDRLIRFGYIGRINAPKGLHIILQALELLPEGLNCEFHIYGGTQYQWEEEYLNESLQSYSGNSRIFVHGLIPHNKITEAFANIDILIVPSLIPEAFGLVVAEAFSAGRPVIVSNSGALPELVRHGIDGFVVDRNDSKAILKELRKFIETPDLIFEMSNQIQRVMNTAEYVNILEACYIQLLNENRLNNH